MRIALHFKHYRVLFHLDATYRNSLFLTSCTNGNYCRAAFFQHHIVDVCDTFAAR